MAKHSQLAPESRPHPPPGGALGTALKLWIVLSRAHEAVARHSAADVARHGLTNAEFAILEVLYHKGPVLLGEVQRRVLVSSGGTTFLVDRLAAKGLVERQACPTDRRARYVVLTRAGEELIAHVFPMHAERIAAATRGLSQKDQKLATQLLKRLGLAAAATPEGSPPATEATPAAPPARRRGRPATR